MRSEAKYCRGLRMTPLAAGVAAVFAGSLLSIPAQAADNAPMMQTPEPSGARLKHATGTSTGQDGKLVVSRVSGDALANSDEAGLPLMKRMRDQLSEQRAERAQQREQVRAQRLQRRAQEKAQATRVERPQEIVGPQSVLVVSNCNDSGPGSLRAAVAGASWGDVIDLGGLPALGCDSILLESEISLPDENLTIRGPGAELLSIDGGGHSRIFSSMLSYSYGGQFSVEGVTLTGGYYTSASEACGGAIHVPGDVVLRNVVISNSRVSGGGRWCSGIFP